MDVIYYTLDHMKRNNEAPCGRGEKHDMKSVSGGLFFDFGLCIRAGASVRKKTECLAKSSKTIDIFPSIFEPT